MAVKKKCWNEKQGKKRNFTDDSHIFFLFEMNEKMKSLALFLATHGADHPAMQDMNFSNHLTAFQLTYCRPEIYSFFYISSFNLFLLFSWFISIHCLFVCIDGYELVGLGQLLYRAIATTSAKVNWIRLQLQFVCSVR